MNEFFENGVINKAINETFIALIPKKFGSCKIRDFRSISLVSILYEIVSRVLVARLKEFYTIQFLIPKVPL